MQAAALTTREGSATFKLCSCASVEQWWCRPGGDEHVCIFCCLQIVAAVREGRRVWDNLRKILLFNLPVNFAQGGSICEYWNRQHTQQCTYLGAHLTGFGMQTGRTLFVCCFGAVHA
jgi:hypothetical protein